MKRLLLTVLTAMAAILPAVAGAPVLAFSESEILLSPGEAHEVFIVLQSLDESFQAMQFQFIMYDASHNPIDGPVRLDSCYDVDNDGNGFFHAENISSTAFTPGNRMSALGHTETGYYSFIALGAYDDSYNILPYWDVTDVTGPMNVFAFTVIADESWNEEFATFELDLDFTKFSNNGSLIQLTDPLVLTIRNSGSALPQTDAPTITAETTDDAVLVTASGNGEVKLYKDGVLVENACTIQRTNLDQEFTFTATAQEDGKLISDVVTMDVVVPAKAGPSGDGISIYVDADQAPYLYSWDSSGSLCGNWPGTLLVDTEIINRVEYYVYHFDKDMVNVIFNDGGSYQTGDFTNITGDAYFIYNGADLAYGLIPPEVYGNPSGEYAFYVNTDGWSQVYAVVNDYSYPMTKVGVDGAGFEVYKWEVPSLDYTPSTITFNNGAGSGVEDASGHIYSSPYVKGGYYVYSFFQNYNQVRLDQVATILYDDSSQRPILEGCAIVMNSTNEVWNGYSGIEFQINGNYFSQQARQGSVWYSVDGGEWIEFTSLLNSEQNFNETVLITFNQNNSSAHSVKLAAKDLSGAFSSPVTVLEAIDARALNCTNLPEVEYTGQEITFSPIICDENGSELVLYEDYKYFFSDNVDAGTANLVIQSIYPSYIGQTSIEFTITPHTISGDVYFTDHNNQYYCTGDPITPEVTVDDATFGLLYENREYVVTYNDNIEPGTAVAVVEGIGNFTGTHELQFEILDYILGDINGDGRVDIVDLNKMLNIIFDDEAFVPAADINKDRIINVQDVVGIVHLLLSGEIPTSPTNSLRAPKAAAGAQASLYWQDGVLYLNCNVPVSALNIINCVDGDITWNIEDYGMVVMETGTQDVHSVIFSFDRTTIPAGLTAIATSNCQNPSVVGAELCNLESERIAVTLNDTFTELTSIQNDDEFNCYLDGSSLVVNSGAAMRDIDVDLYSIDGKVVANRHLPLLSSGRTSIEMSDIINSNSYLIIVIRNGRQILATQKLTQNR